MSKTNQQSANEHCVLLHTVMMSLTLPMLANSSGVRPPAISHLHHSMCSKLSIFFSGLRITSRTQFKYSVLPLTHSLFIKAAPSRKPFCMTIAAITSDTCSCEPSFVDVCAIILDKFLLFRFSFLNTKESEFYVRFYELKHLWKGFCFLLSFFLLFYCLHWILCSSWKWKLYHVI